MAGEQEGKEKLGERKEAGQAKTGEEIKHHKSDLIFRPHLAFWHVRGRCRWDQGVLSDITPEKTGYN